MKFLELCQQRYSVRSYTTEEVTPEQLDYIMECVRLAPSAVNFQPWHFYVVRTEEAKAHLRGCYNREWFGTAPLYIVGCIRHDQAWVRKSDTKEHGNIDIAIAVEHLCLAAAEQGLGTCWVCNFDAQRCHELLGLPASEEPAVLIPIGHPVGEPTPKQRKELTDILTLL